MKHFGRLKRLHITGSAAIAVAVILLSIGLLGYRIYSLNPGLASVETALPPVHQTLQALWNHPLEAPLLLSRLAVAGMSPSTGIGLSRLPSMIIGLATVILLYWLINKWYGYRLALFGTLLLITGPTFLHSSRLATSSILYAFAMALLMCLAAVWHQRTIGRNTQYVSVIALALLLYVPGVLWLLLAISWFERKNIKTQLSGSKKQLAAMATLAVVLLVPLGHMFASNWHSYRAWLGLPASWPTPLTFVEQFFKTWQYIFAGGLLDPVTNLGRLPLVNTFVGLSALIGVYLYSLHRQATRTKQLLSLWLIGTALIALGGPVQRSLLLPIVLVLAVGGIGYLLHLWLKTFPRNPYARSFGIGLLALVTIFAVAYNLRNYYVAWPHTADVKGAFTRQL